MPVMLRAGRRHGERVEIIHKDYLHSLTEKASAS